MPMKITETIVSKTTVRVRFSDGLDPSVEWMDFQVKLQDLETVGFELQYLGELQRAALRYARNAINAENERLVALAGPKS